MRLLLVEDDTETADHIVHALTGHGHAVETVQDGAEGLARARAGDHAALIVDRMLPGLDGLSLVRRLRDEGRQTPVLMLTTMSGLGDRVEGLESGADDYLVKPFAFAELLARVHAITRRGETQEATKLRLAELEMDLIRRTVMRDGNPVELQAQEFRLLEYLLRNAGRVVTRTMLLENVWDLHFDPRTNIVETHMSRFALQAEPRLYARDDPYLARRGLYPACGLICRAAVPGGKALRACPWSYSRFLHTEAFRLSAIYAAIFAVSVLALGAMVLVITDRAFRDQIVEFSQADIAAIQSGYDNEGLEEAREVVQQSMAAPGVSDFFLLQKGARRVAGNLPAMAPRMGIFTVASGGHEILGVGKMLAPGLYAWSGSDLARARIARREMVQTMAWLFAAALLLAVMGGALVSRSFLQKSDAMARACRAIMDGDLKARIPMRGTQDELDRLAGTINEMLGRIAALMENLRQVTNDIAHDLRTPVTHLRQGLERAKDGPAAAHATALETAIHKTDDILALFAALLRIAQIEGGARRAAFTPVELAPLSFQMRDLFAPVAEAADHSLAVEIEQEAEIRGDRALLIQLLSNLIENAILHSRRHQHHHDRFAAERSAGPDRQRRRARRARRRAPEAVPPSLSQGGQPHPSRLWPGPGNGAGHRGSARCRHRRRAGRPRVCHSRGVCGGARIGLFIQILNLTGKLAHCAASAPRLPDVRWPP